MVLVDIALLRLKKAIEADWWCVGFAVEDGKIIVYHSGEKYLPYDGWPPVKDTWYGHPVEYRPWDEKTDSA